MVMCGCSGNKSGAVASAAGGPPAGPTRWQVVLPGIGRPFSYMSKVERDAAATHHASVAGLVIPDGALEGLLVDLTALSQDVTSQEPPPTKAIRRKKSV